MKSQHTTFPSLSGTLAKRSTPTLQPNFAKEPSSPSRSNPRTEMYCSKMKEKSMTDKNGQLVTRYIKNWADTTEIKGCSSLQTLYLFDSNVLRSAQLFIYRNRYQQGEEKTADYKLVRGKNDNEIRKRKSDRQDKRFSFFADPQERKSKDHHTFGTLPFTRYTSLRFAKVKEPNLANPIAYERN